MTFSVFGTVFPLIRSSPIVTANDASIVAGWRAGKALGRSFGNC